MQLCDLLDPNLVINKSFLKMVRFFITKEVAEKFTAVRSARNQSDERTHRFILTALYGIMCGKYCRLIDRYLTLLDCIHLLFLGVIKFKRSEKALEGSDKMFLKNISEVFCNVKSWP